MPNAALAMVFQVGDGVGSEPVQKKQQVKSCFDCMNEKITVA
ncbi:hypothetical protein OROMI_004380 [Orobanche minor]